MPVTKTHDSLQMAMAGAVGVSGGSASRIQNLLSPGKYGGSEYKLVVGATLLDEELVAETPCFKIQYTLLAAGGTHTIWIDKERYLLMKVVQSFPGSKHPATTTYQPRINLEIDATVFDFTPPIESDSKKVE